MNIKRELLQVLIGALLMALFLELGWLDPAKNFWSNAMTSVIIAVISRFIGLILAH